MKFNYYILIIILNIHYNYVLSEIFNFDEITRYKRHCGGFISYGALARDTANFRHYNILQSQTANPYRRGCSQITRCRGG
uniref:Uncharacterized protein n=1 Tax=Meloidogyne enterolobii TaxID=390850 RepID=A0A6V7WUS9_MELEN|nr:unnamed protein product [Meloidogyne enterolobii]